MGKYSVTSDKRSTGFFFLHTLHTEEPRAREIATFYYQVEANFAARACNHHDKLVEAMKKTRKLMIQSSPVLSGPQLEQAYKALDHALADVEKGVQGG